MQTEKTNLFLKCYIPELVKNLEFQKDYQDSKNQTLAI